MSADALILDFGGPDTDSVHWREKWLGLYRECGIAVDGRALVPLFSPRHQGAPPM